MENTKKNYVSKTEAIKMLGITRPTLDAWLKSPKVNLNEVTVVLSKRISVKEIEELQKEMKLKNY